MHGNFPTFAPHPMQLKPTISTCLDTRRANKDKLYPIKLCATFQVSRAGKKSWLQKYYSLGVACSKIDFKVIKGKPKSTDHKKIRSKMMEAEARANTILDDHTFVTVEMFDRLFSMQGSMHTVGFVFNLIMSELKQSGQIGTYLINKTTRNSVARFVDRSLPKLKTRKKEDTIKIDIFFYQITQQWVKDYHQWLKDQVSKSTIGIYMEILRKAYNRAISEGIIKADLYPFGKSGYKIKKSRARKHALDEDEKNKLLSLSGFGIDFWSFSFFNYGFNMADIAALRFRDIQNNVIHISRQKTENVLQIPLRKEAQEIITRWGNKSLDPNEYVFPILNAGLTPTQIKNRINDFLDKVNPDLIKAGKELELPFKLTFGTARHTFASIALEKGASLEFIQIALGHSSMSTTVIYTSGFKIKTKRAIGERIYE